MLYGPESRGYRIRGYQDRGKCATPARGGRPPTWIDLAGTIASGARAFRSLQCRGSLRRAERMVGQVVRVDSEGPWTAARGRSASGRDPNAGARTRVGSVRRFRLDRNSLAKRGVTLFNLRKIKLQ